MNILLNSDKKTRDHRQLKRHLEITRILAELEAFLQAAGKGRQGHKILEFGCGNGFQIPYLETFGKVFVTDIYQSKEIAEKADVAFCESSADALPFSRDTFDIIFSSHVIEHLPQPHRAFAELGRVAKEGCLFVFSVPTNIWLLLSLPAKYIGKLNKSFGILKKSLCGNLEAGPLDTRKRKEMEERLSVPSSGERPLLMKGILPKGHGVYQRFDECYRAFRIRAWTDFFQQGGFTIHSTVPLLLYGPSERPIIPTSARLARYGICSSVLFIMGKRSGDKPPASGAHVS